MMKIFVKKTLTLEQFSLVNFCLHSENMHTWEYVVLSSQVFDTYKRFKMVKIQMDQNGQAGENGHSLKVTRLESARRFCDMMEEEEDISLAQVH